MTISIIWFILIINKTFVEEVGVQECFYILRIVRIFIILIVKKNIEMKKNKWKNKQ